MKNTIFTGAGIAIITPFNADGSINYDELGRIIDDQIANGTDAIIICGTTGESATMTDDEHRDCIKFAVKHVAGRVPVIAGAGSNDTHYAVELSKEAEAAGADCVGSDEIVQKIQGGWLDFDVAVATPDMMGTVGRLGKVLGPRGLMPNPKLGTVTMDLTKAVSEIKAGKVEYRTDKAGNVHCPIGKASFDAEKLQQNFQALIDTLNRVKPAAAKGQYMRSITVSATMGPGIPVQL